MDLPKFDRYEATGILGEGAMGMVYRAFDPRLKREVAIKTIKAEILRQDPGLRARFEREAKIVAALVHPAIVQIYDFGGDYLVMELLKGEELRKLLRDGRQFMLGEIAYLLAQLADGLDYAHSQGVIHRDLKPANLFIDAQNRPKITDFGIAKLVDEAMEGLTAAGQVLGTPAYMSPEQVQGVPLDGRSDQFSLGVVVYQLIAGKSPYAADSVTAIINKILNVPLPPLQSVNPSAPAALEAVMQRVMAKRPDARYPDCRAFAAAFAQAAGVTPDARYTTAPGGVLLPGYITAGSAVTTPLPAAARAGVQPAEKTAIGAAPSEKTAFGPPAFRGAPAAAQKSGMGKWLIGAAALLIVVLGLGFALLKRGGGVSTPADDNSAVPGVVPQPAAAVPQRSDAVEVRATEPGPEPVKPAPIKPAPKAVTRRPPAAASKPAPASSAAEEAEKPEEEEEDGLVKKKVDKGVGWLRRRLRRNKDSGAKPD